MHNQADWLKKHDDEMLEVMEIGITLRHGQKHRCKKGEEASEHLLRMKCFHVQTLHRVPPMA